jgi:two-component system, sensor histidine kinase LadS
MLVNLLSNAVKFTDVGEVRLEVHAQASDAGDEAGGRKAIEFRVHDTGRGIPEEDLERVFGEFEQVRGTAGGTGLGLPISRRLARILGGDLWAESTSASGSTFIFRLEDAVVPTQDGSVRTERKARDAQLTS